MNHCNRARKSVAMEAVTYSEIVREVHKPAGNQCTVWAHLLLGYVSFTLQITGSYDVGRLTLSLH